MESSPLPNNDSGQMPSNIPNHPQPSPSKKNNLIIGATIIVVIVAAAVAIGFWKFNKAPQNQVTSPTTSTPTIPVDNSLPTSYPLASDPAGQPCADSGPVQASKSGAITWQTPTLIKDLELFKSATADPGSSDYDKDISYLIGHFTGGVYQGSDMLLTVMTFSSPQIPNWFHIVRQGTKYTILDKYSDSLPDPQNIIKKTVINEDVNFDLPDLNLPGSLHSASPTANFSYAGNLGFFKNGHQLFCLDHLSKVFNDPAVGDVYTDKPVDSTNANDNYFPRYGFYIKAPDGVQHIYQLNVDFGGQDKIPLVTWDDGKKNSEQYSYQAIGGCGASQFLDIENVPMSDLTQIGNTFNGEALYTYKDSSATGFKDMFDSIYMPDGQTKPTYAQFLADHPLFFWKTPFGQLVRFKIMKYQPLAECGKPVIYLYPTHNEKISVQVNPLGGMTKSDPAYIGGWNVFAKTNGALTDLRTAKNYPYLFWEGSGGMYQTPNKGFIVAQSDIHSFLLAKLSQLGLNDRESADFMEFWEPKMQGSPYYFVTFMGNSVMDSLAPLSINPKPDTIIRILMDFTPLTQPIQVDGYTIKTPKRQGFTVVEWGGVLRSADKK